MWTAFCRIAVDRIAGFEGICLRVCVFRIIRARVCVYGAALRECIEGAGRDGRRNRLIDERFVLLSFTVFPLKLRLELLSKRAAATLFSFFPLTRENDVFSLDRPRLYHIRAT